MHFSLISPRLLPEMRVISCHCRVVSVKRGDKFFFFIKKNMLVIACHCRVVSVGRGCPKSTPYAKGCPISTP